MLASPRGGGNGTTRREEATLWGWTASRLGRGKGWVIEQGQGEGWEAW